MTEIAARLVRPIRRLGRLSLVAVSLAICAALATSALAVRAYLLRDSVLPGVRVAGVDVGGLSRADARARIESSLGERLDQSVDVAVDGEIFEVHPAVLFELDASATARAAFAAARDSWQDRLGALAVPFAVHQDVEPVLRLNPTAESELAGLIEKRTRRPVSAGMSMKGTEPVVEPAITGTTIEPAVLLAQIQDAALRGLPAVEAAVETVTPRITTAAAERAAALARIAVSAPVNVVFRHKQLGALGPERIARLLVFRFRGGAYALRLDAERLGDVLEPRIDTYTRKPVDASFRVVGTRAHVVKGRKGTTLDLAAAERAIATAATEPGLRKARVGLASLPPELTTAEARALGIRRQITTYTTDMGPSSANRIWNVHLMADYIDGTIIKPGQTFSFNKVVGPRTAERGFREGQMIIGSLLVPAIGGGVCQTATTLFNNAFEAGLPIKERYNHSWYISHYPIGRDATVSWGGPDLEFRNDLDHAILIKTSYTDATLTFSFYSTSQHRKVVAMTGPQTNFRSPEKTYAYDPSAPQGSVRTVAGSHARGFDITVSRKVYERGKLVRRDSFASHYVPVGDTVIYGPGTHPPRIDFTLPAI